jgi:putative transposase
MYPEELKERAVRLVFEIYEEEGIPPGAVARVGTQLGIHAEALRKSVHQAEVDRGMRPGRSNTDRQRLVELERENRELRRANDLEVSGTFLRGGARAPTEQVVAFIDTERERLGVKPICRTLQFAPSTFYAAKSRPPCHRRVRDEELKVEIGPVHQDNLGVYGARKVWRQLNREGITIARCRTERLMRQLVLCGRVRGTPPRTTVADTAGPRPPIWSSAGLVPPPPTSCGWPTSPMWPPGPASLTRR